MSRQIDAAHSMPRTVSHAMQVSQMDELPNCEELKHEALQALRVPLYSETSKDTLGESVRRSISKALWEGMRHRIKHRAGCGAEVPRRGAGIPSPQRRDRKVWAMEEEGKGGGEEEGRGSGDRVGD